MTNTTCAQCGERLQPYGEAELTQLVGSSMPICKPEVKPFIGICFASDCPNFRLLQHYQP